jgi:uncharacterized membrane protein YphA (DoxX/SURF4 family)
MTARKISSAARYALGLLLITFGLNGFLQFLPSPPMADPAVRFIGAILETGYLLPLVKLIEISVGVMLLANRFVPLALVLLAPISVNVVAFHLFLDPAGILPAAVVAFLNTYLLFVYRPVYAPMLKAKVEVGGETHRAHATA